MEDSPLISATNSSNTPHHNRHATPGAAAPTAPPPPTQLLTLKLETNTSQSEVNGGSGGGGGGGSTSVSSLSSSCSSSGLSSSSSSSSSSSCNSCYVPPYMPKSNSNPMLVSSSIGGGSNSSSTSPTSITSGVKKSHCTCSKPSSNQASQYQNQNNVLDMLMKKSSSDLEHHQIQQHYHQQHQPYHQNPYGTNQSLITPVNSLNLNSNNLLTNIQQQNSSTQQNGNNGINVAIESAAKKYRCAAQISEASCSWKGKLPPKQYKIAIVYSTKVFVGGLPWDITEEDILKEFGVFGPCRVEWTNKEKFNLLSNNSNNQQQQQEADNNGSYQSFRTNRSMGNLQAQKNSQSDINNAKHRLSPGFAYVIYEGENSVRGLVGNCIEDYQNGRDRVEYYFKISTRRVRNKEVQIIPWILADNNFALCTPKELDPKKTVFVGNLHGTMTARDLAHIMNELFGCVVYAGIDIDKLKYPIGSGRVTFSHQQNFMRAVRAAFVDIQSNKFSKRIQIDPYLEDVQCCLCYSDKGIYFCRDFQCFNYYCGGCWDKQHSYNQLGNHKPLMRKREDKLM
jgi:cytoplasmic polyadenylation element-binding protein